MTEAQFRKACLAVMGEHRAEDCATWSVRYLVTTLAHLGPQGADLRSKSFDAGLVS